MQVYTRKVLKQNLEKESASKMSLNDFIKPSLSWKTTTLNSTIRFNNRSWELQLELYLHPKMSLLKWTKQKQILLILEIISYLYGFVTSTKYFLIGLIRKIYFKSLWKNINLYINLWKNLISSFLVLNLLTII